MLNLSKNLKFKLSVTILIAFYFAGIIGILTHNKTIDFLALTPLNLLVSLVLLILNHENGNNKQWLVFSLIAVLGYFTEVIGVNSGLIFGSYVYGETLGWKFIGTPLIIGVNWMLLTYVVVYTLSSKINNKIGLAFYSAVILVLLDILIEKVAIAYDFWTWTENVIPLKNYMAWFIISFVFCYVIANFKYESKNNLAPYLLIFQFIFFGIFNIVLWK